MSIGAIIVIVFFFSILVLVHEWGHFAAARSFGVRVEEFAFGFPPRIASFVRSGTRYAVNLLPLGGYVKIYGESGDDASDPGSFSSRPVLARIIIIAAGVAMNLVLAWVLFTAAHAVGLPTLIDENAPGAVSVVELASGGPAEKAGIRFGDQILELKSARDAIRPETSADVQRFVSERRGSEIEMEIRRGADTFALKVLARADPPQGEGPIGVALAKIEFTRSPWWRAPWDGLRSTLQAALFLFRALGGLLGGLFARGRVSGEVTGPVGIFVTLVHIWNLGWGYMLALLAGLSVNLAVFNIIPFPGLDGGRILFLAIEKIRGKPVHPKHEQLIHTIGIILLLLLIVFLTQRDIRRFF